MADTQLIDVRKIVAGMRRLNEMKAEIKLVLLFLAPYLNVLAQDAMGREAVEPAQWEEVPAIFSVKGAERDSLVFKSFEIENNAVYALLYVDALGEPMIILKGMWYESQAATAARREISVEQLSKEETLDCYSLLRALLEKVGGYFPSVFAQDLRVFLSAAEQ